jgi:hypothetical protein
MFEELSFGAMLRLSLRVQQGTLAQQAAVMGAYMALLVVGVGGLALTKVSVIFALIGMLAWIVLLGLLAALPYVLAGLMAPRAMQLVSGELDSPPAGAPWSQLASILWASFALSWLVSFMSQFFLIPGLIALSALWSWPMVAACEPGAAGLARAQALVKGRQGKVMTWFMLLVLCMIVPVVITLILLAYAFTFSIGMSNNVAMGLGLLFIAALILGFCVVIQASFWVTIYAVLRHDEQGYEVDELLHVFE